MGTGGWSRSPSPGVVSPRSPVQSRIPRAASGGLLPSGRLPFARRREAVVLRRSGGLRERLIELDELLPRRLQLPLNSPSSSSSSLSEEGVGGVGR